MEKKYDVIVIGAGLGGMAAATLLARNGLGVLLLERHNVPGGYATSLSGGDMNSRSPFTSYRALERPHTGESSTGSSTIWE